MVSTHAVHVISKLANDIKGQVRKLRWGQSREPRICVLNSHQLRDSMENPRTCRSQKHREYNSGEAKTYYKCNVQANPRAFGTYDALYQLVLAILHGQDAQEATLELFDSLSLYELLKEHGSFAAGLRASRVKIVKQINLIPKRRLTDAYQKRWMNYTVRSYSWTRSTTVRAHEMDFAQMYSTIRSHAIE